MTQPSSYYLPALGALWEKLAGAAWPLLRIGYGLFYVPHGLQKLFGLWGGDIARSAKGMEAIGWSPGMFWAYYIGTLELAGGLLIALGLFTRPVAALFIGFMFVAAFVRHKATYFWTAGGMEMPLLLMLVAIVLLIRGSGEFSLDRKIGREL